MQLLDEMNPLEYAILRDAGLNTIKLLQRAEAVALIKTTRRSRSNSPTAMSYGEFLIHSLSAERHVKRDEWDQAMTEQLRRYSWH